MVHKRSKTAQVNLRIKPELKEAAEKAAEEDHRSLTSLIEKLLSEYLQHVAEEKQRKAASRVAPRSKG